MKSLSSRAVAYGLIVLLGLLSALPNVLPNSVSSKLPIWYAENTLTLGLDLRGGSHLLLEVDTSELVKNQNEEFAEELSNTLRKARIPHARPQMAEDAIHITLRDPAHRDELERVDGAPAG